MTEKRRTTESLGEAQTDAIDWLKQEKGKGKLVTSSQLAAEITRLKANPNASFDCYHHNWVVSSARVERMELALLCEKYRGTFDLAGVASELFRMQSDEIIDPFQWTNSGQHMYQVDSVEDLLYMRKMNCFEFVHLCGWIASSQIVDSAGKPRYFFTSGNAIVGRTGVHIASNSSVVTDLDKETPPRGAVIYGIQHYGNNKSGYYHVGIADGKGKVFSLTSRGQGDIHHDTTTTTFNWGYSSVRTGKYHYYEWDLKKAPVDERDEAMVNKIVSANGGPVHSGGGVNGNGAQSGTVQNGVHKGKPGTVKKIGAAPPRPQVIWSRDRNDWWPMKNLIPPVIQED